MNIRRLSLGLALATALALPLGPTGSASAAPAAASGVVKLVVKLVVKPAPYFVVGAVGNTVDWCGWGEPYVYSQADVRLATIKASAPSGIASYDVSTYWWETGPDPSTHYTHRPSLEWPADNYDASCGGGSGQAGWVIRATDNLGNRATVFEEYFFDVDRWNNINATDSPPAPDTWAFAGKWSASACACTDGGTQTFSSTAGAFGSFHVHATAGEHAGLMMAEGPNRGRADIYLDGALEATIDTYHSTNVNRVYVWDSGSLTKGPHTIKVVNLATPGRPRIDVNAMGTVKGIVTPYPYRVP